MNKIICSSKFLSKTIEKYLINVPTYEEDELIQVYTQGKILGIGDWQMDVESQQDWKFQYSFDKLKRLKKALKKVPEQPITIEFTDELISFHIFI